MIQEKKCSKYEILQYWRNTSFYLGIKLSLPLKENPPHVSNNISLTIFFVVSGLCQPDKISGIQIAGCLVLAKATGKVLLIKISHFSSSQTDLNGENLVLNTISWLGCLATTPPGSLHCGLGVKVNYCNTCRNTTKHTQM